MKINDSVRDEILQRDIRREEVKTSALSSDKINKYEYYSPLGNSFKKQTKIKDQKAKHEIIIMGYIFLLN